MSKKLEILQIRSMDTAVYRAIKVECAIQNVKLADMIARMWQAYCAANPAREGSQPSRAPRRELTPATQ